MDVTFPHTPLFVPTATIFLAGGKQIKTESNEEEGVSSQLLKGALPHFSPLTLILFGPDLPLKRKPLKCYQIAPMHSQ